MGRVNAGVSPLVYLSSIVSTAVAGFLARTVLARLDVTVAGQRFRGIDGLLDLGAADDRGRTGRGPRPARAPAHTEAGPGRGHLAVLGTVRKISLQWTDVTAGRCVTPVRGGATR